jgi:SAM-dependent methyltransferase
MKNHYQQDLYKNDFKFFIAHTDEKAVFYNEIKDEIHSHNVESLLDIGAGNGMLSIPLAKEVREYVAVETNPKFVKKLSEAGLDVVEGKFPLGIEKKFDMVLSSHSINYSPEVYEPFLNSSVELLQEGGLFLLIIFKGEEDPWTRLLDQLGENKVEKYNNIFDHIIGLLEKSGTVSVRKVFTHVTTDTVSEMIEALSFVYSDGKDEDKKKFLANSDKLINIIEEDYREKAIGKFVFPFQHFFIKSIKH